MNMNAQQWWLQQEQWRLYQEQHWRLYQEQQWWLYQEQWRRQQEQWRIEQERKGREWRIEQERKEEEWRTEQERKEREWRTEQERKEREWWTEQETKEQEWRIEHQEHTRLHGTWKETNGETIAEEAVHNKEASVECTDGECPICFDLTDAESRYLMPCAHWACVPCMREYMSLKNSCPICCMDIE